MNRLFDALTCCLFAFLLMLLIPLGICALLGLVLADAIERLLPRRERKRA